MTAPPKLSSGKIVDVLYRFPGDHEVWVQATGGVTESDSVLFPSTVRPGPELEQALRKVLPRVQIKILDSKFQRPAA